MNTLLKSSVTFCMTVMLVASIIILSSGQSLHAKTGQLPQDTTKKNNKNQSASYSRKSIITFDENGNPHEEITEDFEGDEELKEMMKHSYPFNFKLNMPSMPGLPNMPDFLEGFMVPPMLNGFSGIDTVDLEKFHFEGKGFEEFSEDVEAMMKEKFESFGLEFGMEMEHIRKQLEKMNFDLRNRLGDSNNILKEEMERLKENLHRDFEKDLNLPDNNDRTETSGSWDAQVKEFESAAQKELVKDGYIEPSEKIESISWSADEIKFNGKTIRPEHVEKYRELRAKYINKSRTRGRPE